MLKVVSDKPAGTIRPEEVGTDWIVVLKGHVSGKLAQLKETACNSGRFYWADLRGAGWSNARCPVFDSIAAALHYAQDHNDEVRVLSSLSELADWIKRECGEKGGEREIPMKEGSFAFCRACEHSEKEFSGKPCASCRQPRPTNFERKE
jgi:hypothetical protein